MEINIKDKVLIKKSDYQNMLRLLFKASFVLGNEYLAYEETQLRIDIKAVIRLFDEDSPVKFITEGGFHDCPTI